MVDRAGFEPATLRDLLSFRIAGEKHAKRTIWTHRFTLDDAHTRLIYRPMFRRDFRLTPKSFRYVRLKRLDLDGAFMFELH